MSLGRITRFSWAIMVLHLSKPLAQRAELPDLQGIKLRTYRDSGDVDVWLSLRHRAFAREKLGVRRWDRADFEAEFLAKDWWSPERLWFAEAKAETSLATVRSPLDRATTSRAVGTITLALRGAAADAKPVVHWLAVLPEWRRRGVGRLLLATLEAACWDAGFREVRLETHAAWTSAIRFYQATGYRPVG